MPTYQYECSECEAFVEVVQSFADSALTDCATCGKPSLKKVYGAVGVVFKGSGFYKTDSRGSASGVGKTTAEPSSTVSTATPATATADSKASTTSSTKSGSSSAPTK